MIVTLLESTKDPERAIAMAAAECRDTPNESREAIVKRIKHIMQKKHLSVLRFAYATIEVRGVSRVCSHQLVRIAHAGIVQRSQRYTVAQHSYVVPPTIVMAPTSLYKAYSDACTYLHTVYEKMLDSGIPQEDARYILPQAVNTSLTMTGNFQTWLKFLELRLKPEAQWEIRQVAESVQKLLFDLAPNIF